MGLTISRPEENYCAMPLVESRDLITEESTDVFTETSSVKRFWQKGKWYIIGTVVVLIIVGIIVGIIVSRNRADEIMERFIRGLPKCELHMHLGGNIEPDHVIEMANRNGIPLKYATVEELTAAYNFDGLQGFLDLFQEVIKVIRTEQDLYDVTYSYLKRAHEDNVRYVEMQYAPLPMVSQGIERNASITGVIRAMDAAEAEFGIKSKLILSCERHLDVSVGLEALELLKPWQEYFVASGLAGSELPFPPELFVSFFDASKAQGLALSAHAGEVGPVSYIEQALDLLHVDRVDHGNAAQTDEAMMKRLAREKIPLTLCPISNLKLNVVDDLKNHPLKKFMDAGLICTVNSDDPSFFAAYLSDNFVAIQKALDLTRDDIIQLAKNSFTASYMPEEDKQKGLAEIDAYVNSFA